MRKHVYVIGLTGSSGMGKSTVSSVWRDRGVHVIDADAIVNSLLAYGGAGVAGVLGLCGAARCENEAGEVGVDREVFWQFLLWQTNALERLEAVLIPLVMEHIHAALDYLEADGASRGVYHVAAIDAPLLFECGVDSECDYVVTVSAPYALQWRRALAREGMSAARLAFFLSRQLPDSEKRRRADFVLENVGSRAFLMGSAERLLLSIYKRVVPE